jgi:hypothetical protein
LPWCEASLASNSNQVVGVVVGFLATDQGSTVYRAASTRRIALVADSPDLIFEVQAVTALSASNVMTYADFASTTAPSNNTGLSGVTLATVAAATTATGNLHLIRLSTKPDNSTTDTFPIWEVMFRGAEHTYGDEHKAT